ncbi:hypothetical protein AAHC03_01666 [Spirometra sp. Aus1]
MEKALSEYISCLEELISELRQLRRTVVNFKDKCDCAKAVGTTVSTGGTALAIGSVLFAIPTGGLSLFVTAAAIGTTVAGAVTNGITDSINHSETKEFIRKAEAVLEKGKRASDELAIHWEKLSAEFEDCKQRGIPEDDAALHAILRVCVCVPTMMPLATVAMEACIKDISSQLLGLSLKAEFLGVKSVLKQNAATVSKMMVKNATAVAKGFAKGAAIGLNVALQVYDIYELFKELDTEHPAATAIGKIISQLEGKLGEARELREAVNAVQRAHQRATRTRATTTQNGRTAQSQSTKDDDKNTPGKNAAECDMGDGAEDEDPKRRPNRRTCENPLSEAEANELIRLLRELVREIQALSEDQRKSKERLQTLLDRFTEILRKMYEAGFVSSIDPKTRNLRLSTTINGRVLSYEISREGFYLCGLDPSDMENVFSTVLFGGSSEHIFCNEEGAVYHICAVDDENQHIRYVGLTRRTTHRRVCEEHMRRIARCSSIYSSGRRRSPSDRNFLRRTSYFYRIAGRAASELGLHEVYQLGDLLEVYCMPLHTQGYGELRFWEIIWQWFFAARDKDGGCNRR